MQEVLISKDKLLTKLKENRETHRAQFKEALEGWKERVLEELEKAVENAKKGLKYETYFSLPRPEDHTEEYNAVIDQVEWNEEEQIELDLHSFNQFIRDDWGWKKDFLTNSAMYMKMK
jgi:hypothetical protein